MYNTLVSRWRYSPAEFNMDVFNLKVRIVIYTFLLLIISAEFLSALGYGLGFLSYNLKFHGPEIAPFHLNITFLQIIDALQIIDIFGNLSSNILFLRS